jgi:hypothetical protein
MSHPIRDVNLMALRQVGHRCIFRNAFSAIFAFSSASIFRSSPGFANGRNFDRSDRKSRSDRDMTPPWDWAIRESGPPRFATRRLRTGRGL